MTDIKTLLGLIAQVDAEIPLRTWRIQETEFSRGLRGERCGKELPIFWLLPDRIARHDDGKPVIVVDEWGQHPDVLREWDPWNEAFLRLVLQAPAAIQELADRLEVLERAAAAWKEEWARGAPGCVPDLPGEKTLWDALEEKEEGCSR